MMPPSATSLSNVQSLQHSTTRELLTLAYPMVISQGAFAVMIFTDRFFMSLVSPTHMAASLGGGVASFFCMSLFIGVLSYTNALVAQYFGKNELSKCPKVVTQGLILTAGFAPLLLALGYIVSDMFLYMGHAPLLAELESKYFLILIWGASFALIKTCLASYFTGIGETRVVMIADTLGVALNIPLSYVLIFGLGPVPELGIIGAACGTIISTLFSFSIFLFFYLQAEHKKRFTVEASLVVDRGILVRFVRLGFPSGIEMFLNVAAFNLFLLMFQSYGVAEAASAAIVFNWDILSFVPMIGLNIAIISLVGRFIGAENMSGLREVIVAGFTMGLIYSAILAVLFFVFREPLVDVFVEPGPEFDAIMTLGSFMMIGLATYVMADSIILIAGGVLRGAGDTQWLMWVSIILHWLMLAGQYLVIHVWEMGPRVSWIVFVIMVLMIGGAYVLRLLGPKWRTPEAFARVMAEQW
jgi:MATE family multidrug resistance protein